jgi:hypothetical protein
VKTARDRAIDIVWAVLGAGFSRPFFVQLLNDTGTTGAAAKQLVDSIERGIEQDRTEQRKALAPS